MKELEKIIVYGVLLENKIKIIHTMIFQIIMYGFESR